MGEEKTTEVFKTYLAWSIFNTLCCCFPLGFIAVICSLRVENAIAVGDTTRARVASRHAKILNITGIIMGAILLIAIIAFYVVIFQLTKTD